MHHTINVLDHVVITEEKWRHRKQHTRGDNLRRPNATPKGVGGTD
jgi:hypothetical protein